MLFVLGIGDPLVWWRVEESLRATHNPRPRLDEQQLRALVTYKRRCIKQSDCEEPLRCMQHSLMTGWRCLASDCENDSHCQPGFMCSPITHTGVPPIRLCTIQGTQREGDRCEDFPLRAERGYQPGLICNSGYCGRPCDPDRPPPCPEGFVCHAGSSIPACLPSCLKRGCPPGKRCVRFIGELSVCVTIRGQDCDEQPCTRGEICRRVPSSRWTEDVVNMWCALPCNEREGRFCPAGFACVNGSCKRMCDEGDAGSCAPGERCNRLLAPERYFGVCSMWP